MHGEHKATQDSTKAPIVLRGMALTATLGDGGITLPVHDSSRCSSTPAAKNGLLFPETLAAFDIPASGGDVAVPRSHSPKDPARTLTCMGLPCIRGTWKNRQRLGLRKCRCASRGTCMGKVPCLPRSARILPCSFGKARWPGRALAGTMWAGGGVAGGFGTFCMQSQLQARAKGDLNLCLDRHLLGKSHRRWICRRCGCRRLALNLQPLRL